LSSLTTFANQYRKLKLLTSSLNLKIIQCQSKEFKEIIQAITIMVIKLIKAYIFTKYENPINQDKQRIVTEGMFKLCPQDDPPDSPRNPIE